MLKSIKAELAARKGVRLGVKGGSLGNYYSKGVGDIPVSIEMYTHTFKIRKRTEETTERWKK
jgi:hypothetical protein